MGREWELSYRLGMRPWIFVAYSAPVAAATAVFFIYPFGQGSSLMECRWESRVPLTTCWYSKLSTTFLCIPSICLGSLVFLAALCFQLCMGSLVTSSLVRETTEEVSHNYGYKFGQEEEMHITSSLLMVTLGVSSFNTLVLITAVVSTSSLQPGLWLASGSLLLVFSLWRLT